METAMLELEELHEAGGDRIMVHARFDGAPVHFHIDADAVDDFLQIEAQGVTHSMQALTDNWHRFVPRLEAFIARREGHDFLITTALLNP